MAGLIGKALSSAFKGLEGGANAIAALGQQGMEKQYKLDLAKETAAIDMEKQLRIAEITGDQALRRSKETARYTQELTENSPKYLKDLEVSDSAIAANKSKERESNLALRQAEKMQRRIDKVFELEQAGKIDEAAKLRTQIYSESKLRDPSMVTSVLDNLNDQIKVYKDILTSSSMNLDRTAKENAKKKLEQYQDMYENLYKQVYGTGLISGQSSSSPDKSSNLPTTFENRSGNPEFDALKGQFHEENGKMYPILGVDENGQVIIGDEPIDLPLLNTGR